MCINTRTSWCETFCSPPIPLYNSLCMFSNTGHTVCVSGAAWTHTPPRTFTSPEPSDVSSPHITLVIYDCRSVFLCVSTYQCQLCSATGGRRRVRGDWVKGEAVVRLCVEGGRVGLLIPALCLPWQGGGPTPVRCWNRPGPYSPPCWFGAGHDTAADQGSSSHPGV